MEKEKREKTPMRAWISGFEGEFQIDTLGNIYSWKSGEPKLIKPSPRANGHAIVCLTSKDRDGECRQYVHRLVYETFKLHKLKRSEWIKHKDGDLSNNNITNLEIRKVGKDPEISGSNTIKYEVHEEGGIVRAFSSREDISKEYGLSSKKIIKGLKTGEWVEVLQKKNL
jgi:hypothetical protein